LIGEDSRLKENDEIVVLTDSETLPKVKGWCANNIARKGKEEEKE